MKHLFGVLAITLGFLAGGAFAGERPNVIFIMADDLGYGDLGSYGQQVIQTPHLDRMAREGLRFTQVYAGSPVCAPARSVLMTGQHTGRTRVRGNAGRGGVRGPLGEPGRVPLEEKDVTVAEVLKSAGYVTGITGKWGLGEPGTPGVPNRKGFDEWLGFLNQRRAHDYYPDYIWHNEEKLVIEGNQDGRQEEYVHDLFTRFALDFVNRHGRGERPFFLYLPYTIPHDKFQIPELEPYAAAADWPMQAKVYASMITGWTATSARFSICSRNWALTKTPSCSSAPTTARPIVTRGSLIVQAGCAGASAIFMKAASAHR
jgi:arylsulfatase A-like enzyme